MKPGFLISALLTLLSLAVHAGEKPLTVSVNRLDSIIAATPVTPVEGVWQFLPDNAAIAIIRRPGSLSVAGPTQFDIYLYSTVTSRMLSGTLLGTLSATPQADTYLAEMFADPNGKSGKRKSFIIKLTDPSHLSFSKLKNGLSIDLWRLVPYLFRVSVKRDTSSDNLHGCVKLKPLVPGVSEPVRYL